MFYPQIIQFRSPQLIGVYQKPFFRRCFFSARIELRRCPRIGNVTGIAHRHIFPILFHRYQKFSEDIAGRTASGYLEFHPFVFIFLSDAGRLFP